MRPRALELRWTITGLVVLALGLLLVLRFQASPSEELLEHAARVEAVTRLRRELAAAVEAEKSAVLALTDAESRSYADRARLYTAAVLRDRDELKAHIDRGGGWRERALLGQFDEAFAELRRIDETILALAVRNTNLKASALAFGSAREALGQLDSALAHLIDESARSPSTQAKQVMNRADDARAAALHIALLVPRHIAEERTDKMDELESDMTREDARVRQDLDALGPLGAPVSEVAKARASYARYTELREQILVLSRENTNVRSLSLSLHEKRKATTVCDETLEALEQAIESEPVPGSRRAVQPR